MSFHLSRDRVNGRDPQQVRLHLSNPSRKALVEGPRLQDRIQGTTAAHSAGAPLVSRPFFTCSWEIRKFRRGTTSPARPSITKSSRHLFRCVTFNSNPQADFQFGRRQQSTVDQSISSPPRGRTSGHMQIRSCCLQSALQRRMLNHSCCAGNRCACMELGEPLRAPFVPSLQPCVLSRLCWCLVGSKPFQERADSRLCRAVLLIGGAPLLLSTRVAESQ